MITQKISTFFWSDRQDFLGESFADGYSHGGQGAFEVMVSMKKLRLAAIRRAIDGAA